MPCNLAVLDVNAAFGIQERFPDVKHWYIGGHSLGGSMAASYLASHASDFEGLILLAAYSTADLSNTSLSILSIYGSEDGVMNRKKYEKYKTNLSDYEEMVIEQFIRYSGRPVFSMEAATGHPLQSFADLITIEEHKAVARPKVVLTWAPHPKALPQAVPNSFAEWMNAADYELVVTHPKGYELDSRFVRPEQIEYDQRKAFEGADFIYAKNWSAFEDENYGAVLSTDRDWTVDSQKMALTNNAYFMHCLPVRRNMIVTDDVIESERSLVIPEAANREISAQVVIKRLLENL
jgi:N-succinyl-L-ornithine transcarbamylase